MTQSANPADFFLIFKIFRKLSELETNWVTYRTVIGCIRKRFSDMKVKRVVETLQRTEKKEAFQMLRICRFQRIIQF